LGYVSDANGNPLAYERLWALAFGNGNSGGSNVLFFTAGINGEQDGLFGSIRLDSGPGPAPLPEPGAGGHSATAGIFIGSSDQSAVVLGSASSNQPLASESVGVATRSTAWVQQPVNERTITRIVSGHKELEEGLTSSARGQLPISGNDPFTALFQADATLWDSAVVVSI
jgi:hypothetical protein